MVVVKPYNLFRVALKTIIWHVVIMKIWYFVQGVESIRRNIIWWTDRYWFCFMRNMPREIFNFREYVIEIYKHIIIDKLKERYRAGKFCVHHNNNIIYPSIVLFYFPIPNIILRAIHFSILYDLPSIQYNIIFCSLCVR